MNEKILKLANALYNNEECKNQKFHLTLNHEEVIKDVWTWENIEGTTAVRNTDIISPYLNEEGMKRIADELSKKEVKNFNLTVEFEHGTDKGCEHFDKDWYHCYIIFWGEKKRIKIAFNMLSRYCSFDHGAFDNTAGKVKIDEDRLGDFVQKMVELKNTLIDNGNRLMYKLSEIKNL